MPRQWTKGFQTCQWYQQTLQCCLWSSRYSVYVCQLRALTQDLWSCFYNSPYSIGKKTKAQWGYGIYSWLPSDYAAEPGFEPKGLAPESEHFTTTPLHLISSEEILSLIYIWRHRGSCVLLFIHQVVHSFTDSFFHKFLKNFLKDYICLVLC